MSCESCINNKIITKIKVKLNSGTCLNQTGVNSTTLMELLLIVRLSLNLRRTFVIDWCFDNPEQKLSLLQHLKDTSSVQGADTSNTPSRGFIKH